jgi:3',5'-cyclic-AMP phosphodiesterase
MAKLHEPRVHRRQALEWVIGRGATPRSTSDGAAKAAETGLSFLEMSDSREGLGTPTNAGARATLAEPMAKIVDLSARSSFVIAVVGVSRLSKSEHFADQTTTRPAHRAPSAARRARHARSWRSVDGGRAHFVGLVSVGDSKAEGKGRGR